QDRDYQGQQQDGSCSSADPHLNPLPSRERRTRSAGNGVVPRSAIYFFCSFSFADAGVVAAAAASPSVGFFSVMTSGPAAASAARPPPAAYRREWSRPSRRRENRGAKRRLRRGNAGFPAPSLGGSIFRRRSRARREYFRPRHGSTSRARRERKPAAAAASLSRRR